MAVLLLKPKYRFPSRLPFNDLKIFSKMIAYLLAWRMINFRPSQSVYNYEDAITTKGILQPPKE